ncbi:hypothetical protein RFI_03421 [Reticulomyxa filosa]|uniref:SAM domain-containing protein n=1 Tax=Reticulomyxa filosa TaxID=46433 RepID=X6P6E2_RETFI|nr:hypothetical protein RFI_03421 [Reticulomyxa filosa]|eukprot:ETO33683.1 hypothetical protein RFI_03421 [Reticulomyxa filosa]
MCLLAKGALETNNSSQDIRDQYNQVLQQIVNLQNRMAELEQEINSQLGDVKKEIIQRCDHNSEHLRTFIEKEHELFLARLQQNSAREELSVMSKQQEDQIQRIAALEQTNQQQMALLSTQQREFEQMKQQYTLLNEQRANDRRQSHLNTELLQHQLEEAKAENQKQIEQQQTIIEEQLEKEKTSLWNRFFSKNTPSANNKPTGAVEQANSQTNLESQQPLPPAEDKKQSNEPPRERPSRPTREKRPLDPHQYRTWDSDDVYYWLSEAENGKWQDWASVLYRNQISGDMLDDLNGQDLVQLGIETLGARKKLLQMIKSLQVSLLFAIFFFLSTIKKKK